MEEAKGEDKERHTRQDSDKEEKEGNVEEERGEGEESKGQKRIKRPLDPHSLAI